MTERNPLPACLSHLAQRDAALRAEGFGECQRAAKGAQPSTAEDPNESVYTRGYFDGVIAYGRALAALKREDSK